jgi:Ala-tRNA(Pro) deacylase
MNVQQFLKEQQVSYSVLNHEPTYDAQHMAQAVHESGEHVAKTVLLRAGNGYVMAVVPATHQVDLAAVKRGLSGARRVELATELEFGRLFTDCEIGAVPPFGSQYGLKTLVDARLAQQEEIVFEGNTHEESVGMRYRDYERIEKPMVATISRHV